MKKHLALVAILALLLAGPLRAQDDPKPLAAQARTVFKTHCHRCHHGEGSKGGSFDVLRDKTLTTAAAGEQAGRGPRQARTVRALERAGIRKNMPPRAIKERPSDADLAILEQWIAGRRPAVPHGAVQPQVPVSLTAVLTAVRDDLRNAEVEDRPFLRYFTLTHLYNNPHVPDMRPALCTGPPCPRPSTA